MKRRCTNRNAVDYPFYGGRGITFHPRWNDFHNFIEDMGERPVGASLDRIDNTGPYSKDNCRWATRKQQDRNRSTNRLLTFNGETKTIMDWAEGLGLSDVTIGSRLRRGWSVEQALTVPVVPPNSRWRWWRDKSAI